MAEYHYGGQAVMEGVMIRGQKTVTTAVRLGNGEITVNNKPLSPLFTGRIRKIPFLRGIIVLIESLVLGIGSLLYSANVVLEEETDTKISGGTTWLILTLSIAFGVGLFFLVPLGIAGLLNPLIESAVVFNLVEGGVRLLMFVIYLWLIAFMPDVRRVFAYHGAEHKTINAFEAGVPLEAAEVDRFSTAHTRCGTAFLLAVLVIAILVFSLVGKQAAWIMVSSRIVLLPVIAALGYEATQYGSRHIKNPLVKAAMMPGLWLQKLTTRQPDEKQIGVAIAALKGALAIDKGEEPAPV